MSSTLPDFDSESFIASLSFDEAGLIPGIIQDYRSQKVLMLGYLNEQSLRLTLQDGFVTYWSRSRQQLWRKGETSGQLQVLKALAHDCDSDTLLITVEQLKGITCHTGTETCFSGREIPLKPSSNEELQ